jgi:hypothetical protein
MTINNAGSTTTGSTPGFGHRPACWDGLVALAIAVLADLCLFHQSDNCLLTRQHKQLGASLSWMALALAS